MNSYIWFSFDSISSVFFFIVGEFIISSGHYTLSSDGPGYRLICENCGPHLTSSRRFVLELSNHSHRWRILLDSLPKWWFHFAFTWSREHGLKFYKNGKLAVKSQKPDFLRNRRNAKDKITIGKPNSLTKIYSYGGFSIGHFTIWSYELSWDKVELAFLSTLTETTSSIKCCHEMKGNVWRKPIYLRLFELTDGMIDMLTDQQTDGLTDWQIDRLTDWDRLMRNETERQINWWLIHQLNDWLTHPCNHLPTDSLAHASSYPFTRTSTHPLAHSPTRALTHLRTHSLTHSPSNSLTLASTHPRIQSLTHPLTHLCTTLLPTHPLTHSPTHPLTHLPTHPLIHSPTYTLILSLSHPLAHSPIHPLTYASTHPLTHSPTHPLTHSLTSSHTHSLTVRKQTAADMVHCFLTK